MNADWKARSIFIAWTTYQRRVVSMEKEFGFSTVFLGRANAGWTKPWSYLALAIRTVALLWRKAPACIWLQMPPLPLLLAVLLYRMISLRRCVLLADCHNSMLRTPWSTIPGVGAMLSRCNVVLVHNTNQVGVAAGMGVPTTKLWVLPDAPATFAPVESTPELQLPMVLVPFSFSPDEPVEQLIAAATTAQELMFMVTGNFGKAPVEVVKAAPQNLRFCGYVPLEEFDRLMSTADVVLGLTKLEGVQLSVANEAIGAAKPLVLSDTHVLRDLFGECADFCDWREPDSIANACRDVIASKDKKATRMRSFRDAWRAKWRATYAEPLLKELGTKLATDG